MRRDIVLVFVLFAAFILSIPPYIYEVEAGIPGFVQNDSKVKEVYYLRGDLTATKNDKPYDIVGSYLISVNWNDVKITADFKLAPSRDMTLQGWLVGADGKSYLNVGQFTGDMLSFHQKDMEAKTYDQFIVSEEPKGDTNPSLPHSIVGGSPISLKIYQPPINRHE